MQVREFRKAGHTPSLIAALVHFDGYGVGLGIVGGVALAALVGITVVRAVWRRGWGRLAEARV